ncbi:hypothetical protein SAMN05216390_1263 [Lachnospiraceae bacterium KH1T2]|nr:hypothetical protein SAMN05216390_1263 [Lachnospiraceae bacterium KH1T2]
MELSAQINAELDKAIDDLTLFDDDLMSKVFDDGAHIIYVNGKYRGEDDFGKLAHDFNCKDADDIYFKPFADGVRHFKKN